MSTAGLTAFAIAALAIGTSACDSSDPGCTKANCEALLNCTAWVFPTLPCGSLPPGSESQADIDSQSMQSCVDACNAEKAGTFLQCVADKFPGTTCQDISLDGGDRIKTLVAACTTGTPPCGANCNACETQCGETNSTCNAPCLDAGTLGACVSCNSDCGVKWAQCQAACPTN